MPSRTSLLYAITGGLLAILIHALFFETGWPYENSYLHVFDILSWILIAFFIGRMKEGWDRRTRELEHANAELQKEMEERQKAEQAMREREELFSDLFDNSRDMIQSIAPDGRIIYANRAWRENLGFAKNEVPGFPMFEVIHPDCHAHCMERFEALLSGREVDKIETEFVARDGRRIMVEGKCNCKFVDNKPVAIRGIFRDVTERRKLEIELQKAQKLEAIGILAGGIAHDFNNILTGLLAVITLVKNALPPESEQIEILEEARQSCLQGKELTGKFITFAEGGSPLKKCINIRELLQQSVEIALRGADIACQFALAADMHEVLIDAGQMQQVFNNVVINAREAMVNGGEVRVRAENQQVGEDNGLDVAPGAYLRIAITDQGVGIPQENLARIFDPYFTTKRMASQRGTGFGLAICYSIMRKHGGTITVESENGKGTTFYIYLPACP
ncbi:MAG: PAS domain S-box protein [Desulfurivibrio sp.]|nr:MAG: PAS domain S-box protein [Desulfurivibrio sp.]